MRRGSMPDSHCAFLLCLRFRRFILRWWWGLILELLTRNFHHVWVGDTDRIDFRTPLSSAGWLSPSATCHCCFVLFLVHTGAVNKICRGFVDRWLRVLSTIVSARRYVQGFQGIVITIVNSIILYSRQFVFWMPFIIDLQLSIVWVGRKKQKLLTNRISVQSCARSLWLLGACVCMTVTRWRTAGFKY